VTDGRLEGARAGGGGRVDHLPLEYSRVFSAGGQQTTVVVEELDIGHVTAVSTERMTHCLKHVHRLYSDILVLQLISVLVFILFSSRNFYFI